MSEIQTVKKQPAKPKILRPSALPKDVEDTAKYLRENGEPNPLILYRVTVASKPVELPQYDPLEIDAVDPADAINQYITASGIKTENVCRMSFQVSEQEK